MSKRPSKKVTEPEHLPVASEPETEQQHEVLDVRHTLATIRNNVLRTDTQARTTQLETREENGRMIAELEALRDEIERTIAFLKAR
jgi:hypothetical protein